MRLNSESGLIKDTKFIASPNCDERPANTEINLIAIHGISLPPGKYGGPWVIDLFTNSLDEDVHPYFQEIKVLKVSCHLLIRRDGSLLQFVPLQMRAWHAGESCYQGKEKCNDFSIGIELEGDDDIPYENIQYKVLSEVASLLIKYYPAITSERIVGHCDIAPGRKTDPGPTFDWVYFRSLLKEKIHS